MLIRANYDKSSHQEIVIERTLSTSIARSPVGLEARYQHTSTSATLVTALAGIVLTIFTSL